MDIAEFLTARYDEEQQLAERAAGQYADGSPWGPRWTYDREHFRVLVDGQLAAAVEETSDVDGEHIAYHDPARVLADLAAKRAIVAKCEEQLAHPHAAPISRYLARDALKLFAQPFADHPDFRPEWRIDA